MSIKDIEHLKVELSNLREKNRQLYHESVQPAIKVKVEEFLNAFEDYFRARGFVVKKEPHSVMVAYSSLEFKAFTNETQDIFIMKEREQIASISVKYKGVSNLGAYNNQRDDLEEPDQLKSEIEKEKALEVVLENPEFYYTGSDFGHQYENPLSVLDSIFHV